MAKGKELFGGKRRSRMRGGQQSPGNCNFGGAPYKMHGGYCPPHCELVDGGSLIQKGGAHSALSPASLSGDSFDRSGAQLANTAHAVYVQKNIDLAAIKGVNAMKGGVQLMRNGIGGRRSRRTAKKYSRSKSSKSARRGGGLVEAVVPLGLLAAQQTLFKRGSSNNKRHNKYGGSRRRSRSRRN